MKAKIVFVIVDDACSWELELPLRTRDDLDYILSSNICVPPKGAWILVDTATGESIEITDSAWNGMRRSEINRMLYDWYGGRK